MLIKRRTLIKSAGATAATIAAPWINVSRAADLMGISRGALRNKIEHHKINPRTYARPLAHSHQD